MGGLSLDQIQMEDLFEESHLGAKKLKDRELAIGSIKKDMSRQWKYQLQSVRSMNDNLILGAAITKNIVNHW